MAMTSKLRLMGVVIRQSASILVQLERRYLYRLSCYSRQLSTASKSDGKSEDGCTPISKIEQVLEENPFAKKYKAKIDQEISKRTIVKDGIEVLVDDAFKQENQFDSHKNLRKSQPASSLQHTNGAKDNTSLSNILGKSDLPSFAPSLSSILDPEDVINASANEIQERWTQKVCSHDMLLSACIPAEVHEQLYNNGKAYPLFIYPLPKENGFDIYLSQCTGNVVAFTSLLDYQTHGENARSVLTLFQYTELKQSKGIVLMLAEVDTDRMALPAAQLLIQQNQMYFANQRDPTVTKLVKTFNTKPESFDYMNIIHRFHAWFGEGFSLPDKKVSS